MKKKAKNDYTKYIANQNYQRVFGGVYVIFGLIYLIWLWTNLNLNNIFIGLLFFLSQAFTYFVVALSVFNHWRVRFRTRRPDLPNDVPPVAVVISTYREPVSVVEKTVRSLFHISYPGKLVILVSNDDQDIKQKTDIEQMMLNLSTYWKNKCQFHARHERVLHLRHSKPHRQAKAGNLNQALGYLRKYYPEVDLVLTQDADEVVYPDILKAIVGYFSDPKVAYVQTIKQARVDQSDPFGNRDLMWYGRTAPSRDAVNAMYACGSGVVWRISAVESIGGFSTWNLVEDLTTSYELLSRGWTSRYHYEALSYGIAPEDLANFIKQRGTWAIDTMRLFFWDNLLTKKGLTLAQRLQFLETPLFYLNGISTLTLIMTTSISLVFETWPTRASSFQHAMYLMPGFVALELYLLFRAGKMVYIRERQFWAGLSPVYLVATAKALFYGPNKKPRYKVTRKKNSYDNYLLLVMPQIVILAMIAASIIKIVTSTPLYSAFDWPAVFWCFYQASFLVQIIKVSLWKWSPNIDVKLFWEVGKLSKMKELRPYAIVRSIMSKKSPFDNVLTK